MTKRLLVAFAATVLGMVLVQAPLAPAGAAPPAPTPTCFGEPATIFLPTTESSATSVVGTSGDDVIVTGEGADTVEGRGGRDLICTRGGPDVIRGGAGDDRMRGGSGVDSLRGRGGLDRADGGEGDKDVCAAERKTRCEADFS